MSKMNPDRVRWEKLCRTEARTLARAWDSQAASKPPAGAASPFGDEAVRGVEGRRDTVQEQAKEWLTLLWGTHDGAGTTKAASVAETARSRR